MSAHEKDGRKWLEATDVLPPSRLVGGKYRLGRLLGEGGMGAVYEAEHTGLGTIVAVKLLNESFATDHNALSRFRREARAAAAVRHENVVSVFDTGADDRGIPFIVMEMLEGESLSTYLRREGALRPEVATAVTLQILAGLDAAHAKTVVHRDLKPGNIVLARQPDGTQLVKILDFGISKYCSDPNVPDVTATGAVIGTPRFMAPEQARGDRDIDHRVDLYAVGVLLYRMTTGKLPFGGSTQREIIDHILEGNPQAPREAAPHIPRALEAVILKALAVNPAHRQQSALEMSDELRDAVPAVTADEPIPISVAPTTNLSAMTPRTRNTLPSLVAAIDPADPSAYGRPEPATTASGPWNQGGGGRFSTTAWVLAGILVLLIAASLWLALVPRTSTTAKGPGPSDPFSAGEAYGGPPLRVGITRFVPEKALGEEHAPLIEYLAETLRRPVKLIVLDGYVDLAERLQSGQLELAALAASAYVKAAAHKPPGVRLLATHVTDSGKTYHGFIVARANSGFRSLDDLKGRVFCYVNTTSTSGYLYPRAEFRRHGIDPDTAFKAIRFTSDHLAALRTLHDGACDGAAVFASMLYSAGKHGMPPEQFKPLLTTTRIPNDAYCVSSSLPADLAQVLRDALLALKPLSPLAVKVLGTSGRIRGFAPAADSDYDPVRKMERYLDQAPVKGRARTP